MKKVFAFLMSVVMSLGIFASCGPQQGSDSSENGGTSAPAFEESSLKLVLSTADGSSTDDRIPTPWYNRNMATNLMFRSLFIADSTLTSVKPDLADYTVSEDGLTYVITVKDDLKWSDGEPLTAEDVVFSIKTAQKAASINAIYTSAFAKIAEMVVEDNVLTMRLDAPYASMANVLAQFAILPKHVLKDSDPLTIDADPFWQHPVTSGFYTIDEFKVGNYFTLKPNEYYEGEPPKIKKVTVSFVTDYVTAAQSGLADYLHGNATDIVEALRKTQKYTAYEVDVLFYKYFIFNMEGIDGRENAAMQNVAVRKAIIEAIDRAALTLLYPNASVLNSGVPDSYDAYNGFSYRFDAEQAKEDLKAAGYDFNRTFKICYYNNDQTSIDLINIVAYYLGQAGLKVETALSNDGTTDLFTTRDYDLGFKGKSAFSIEEWYTEYLSSDALFANIFGGDTTFDELVAELFAATEEEKRNEVLRQLQALEQEKVYKVPVFTVGTYVFVENRLKLPQDVKFCNPLYSCDLNFSNWEIA